MSLQELLQQAARLRTLGSQLSAALARLQSIKADAASAVDQLAAEHPAYLRIVRRPAERAREQADFEQSYREARRVAAGVLLFELESRWPTLDAELRGLREQSKQAPPPVAVHLRRTGGHHLSLSTAEEVQIQVLAEMYRQRFREELRDAPPSTVRDVYEAATHLDSDEAASLVRYVESVHGDGWRGRTPESSEQVQAAISLRSLVAQTQAGRIPPELDAAAEIIEDVSRLVGKASHEKLHAITSVNLSQRPDLADLWETEHPALEQAAAEAVERAKQEAAAVRESEAAS